MGHVLTMSYSYLLHKLIDFSAIFSYFIHYFALNSFKFNKFDPVIYCTVDFSTFRIIILNYIHDVLFKLTERSIHSSHRTMTGT